MEEGEYFKELDMVDDLGKLSRRKDILQICEKFELVTRKSDLLERHKKDRNKSSLLNEDVQVGFDPI